MLSYGKFRLNHLFTWISWRDSLLGLCVSDTSSFRSVDCVCRCVTLFTCVIGCMMTHETDESFVGLLTSPLHSNLSSCSFTKVSGSADTLGKSQTWRIHWCCFYRESKRLRSLLIVWLPSPFDLFLVVCSWRPQLMMQPELAAQKQEAETSLSFHPATLFWQQPSCLYLVNGSTWHHRSGCHKFLFDLNS